MAFIREPTPRLRSDGKWFVRWGGKDHYLGRDAELAKKAFYSKESTHPGNLRNWRDWAKARRAAVDPARRALARPQLIDIAKDMFRDYLDRDRTQAVRYFRTALARFMRIHGEADLIELTTPAPRKGRYAPPIVALLNAYIADAKAEDAELRRKNKTINHEATAVKRLFNWAAQNGRCPAVLWRGVTRLPTRRGAPQVRTPEEIIAAILTAGEANPDLVPWLALTYLCCLRPSETVTLVCNSPPAEWLDVRDLRGKPLLTPRGQPPTPPHAPHPTGGILRLGKHKGSWRGEEFERFVVVSPEAAAWLPIARRAWSRLDSWSKAAVAAGVPVGPSLLRDSAASHLRFHGARVEDVEILLGHMPPGEWKSYAAMPWPDLHALAGRITLRSTRGPTSSRKGGRRRQPAQVDPAEWARRIAELGDSLAPRHRLAKLRELRGELG